MPEIIERKVFDPWCFPDFMNQHFRAVRLLTVYYGETEFGSHLKQPIVFVNTWHTVSRNMRRRQYERALHKWWITEIGYWHYDRNTPELVIEDEYFEAHVAELTKAASEYEELLARAGRPERVRIVREVKVG